MKISHRWLEAYTERPLALDTLTTQLTQLGLEVGTVELYGKPLKKVVAGCIKQVVPHPNADRLRVCAVDVGQASLLQIVCGAANVFEGMYAPVALPGGQVGDLLIQKTEIRGVASDGMLCSAAELGIEGEGAGILDLGRLVATGTDLIDFLHLDDTVIDLELTPNRGDCLSMAGVARELAALSGQPLKPVNYSPIKPQHDQEITVDIGDGKHCSRYLACIVHDIDPAVATPLWMKERLRRCGIAPVAVVVDIMNYVMLSLGQPMHAFDFTRLSGGIQVRCAEPSEKMVLLNDQQVELTENTLLIADAQGPVAMAGIMGGKHSAVSNTTTSVLLESAYFSPLSITAVAQSYKLHTEAAYRFERGVDFMLQQNAICYACELLSKICGGKFGKITEAVVAEALPVRPEINLTYANIEACLGQKIERSQVAQTLSSLQIKHRPARGGWICVPPSYRFDLEIEEDLFEELGRFYGYDRIQGNKRISLSLQDHSPEDILRIMLRYWVERLVTLGYHEVITYSFSNPAWFDSEGMAPALQLSNPISPELSVMRTSLFPGLLQVLAYNLKRQQKRLKLFETGRTYYMDAQQKLCQQQTLAGLFYGTVLPQQWGEPMRPADFYDLKNDLTMILKSLHADVRYVALEQHAFFHPRASAGVQVNGVSVGAIGLLDPRLESLFELSQPAWLFELALEDLPLTTKPIPRYQAFSRYPSIRRDISIIINKETQVSDILDTINSLKVAHCTQVCVLDVYEEDGAATGKKSVMLGLVFQDQTQTLGGDQVAEEAEKIMQHLQQCFNAQIKGRDT